MIFYGDEILQSHLVSFQVNTKMWHIFSLVQKFENNEMHIKARNNIEPVCRFAFLVIILVVGRIGCCDCLVVWYCGCLSLMICRYCSIKLQYGKNCLLTMVTRDNLLGQITFRLIPVFSSWQAWKFFSLVFQWDAWNPWFRGVPRWAWTSVPYQKRSMNFLVFSQNWQTLPKKMLCHANLK